MLKNLRRWWQLRKLRHLWNGSDRARLCEEETVVWQVQLQYGASGPTPQEAVATRRVVDKFRDVPTGAVLHQIRSRTTYTLTRGDEPAARACSEAAEAAGLRVSIKRVATTDSVLVRPGSIGLDGELPFLAPDIRADVIGRMLARGAVITAQDYRDSLKYRDAPLKRKNLR